MTPSHPNGHGQRGEVTGAFSVMFFCIGFLCLMLGWADGVRHDRAYLHIPETGGWLIATAVFVALGLVCLVWSRISRRS